MEEMTDRLVRVKEENIPLESDQYQADEDVHKLLEQQDNVEAVEHTSGAVVQENIPYQGHQNQCDEYSQSSKFTKLKTNLECRSQALTVAWTQLSSVLSEYKAELLMTENLPNKYDNLTNVDELKSQLIEKENDNIRLMQQVESLQQANEHAKMDVSIKDGLLRKYQDDLLQRETTLIHVNTKVCKLESKIRVMESRDSGPRKVARTMTPGRMPHLPRKMDIGAVKFGSSLAKSMQKRPRPAPVTENPPPQPMTSPPAQPSTSAQQEPIVCIEVEDDDVITDVRQAAEAVSQEQDTMFLESYTDKNYDTNSSYQDQNLGEMEYNSSLDQSGQFAMEESGLEQAMEPTVQGALEQGWDQMPTPQRLRAAGAAQNKGSNYFCPYCERVYRDQTSRRRHVNQHHLDIKKYVCSICGSKFGQCWHLKRHVTRRHGLHDLVVMDDGNGQITVRGSLKPADDPL